MDRYRDYVDWQITEPDKRGSIPPLRVFAPDWVYMLTMARSVRQLAHHFENRLSMTLTRIERIG